MRAFIEACLVDCAAIGDIMLLMLGFTMEVALVPLITCFYELFLVVMVRSELSGIMVL